MSIREPMWFRFGEPGANSSSSVSVRGDVTGDPTGDVTKSAGVEDDAVDAVAVEADDAEDDDDDDEWKDDDDGASVLNTLAARVKGDTGEGRGETSGEIGESRGEERGGLPRDDTVCEEDGESRPWRDRGGGPPASSRVGAIVGIGNRGTGDVGDWGELAVVTVWSGREGTSGPRRMPIESTSGSLFDKLRPSRGGRSGTGGGGPPLRGEMLVEGGRLVIAGTEPTWARRGEG